MIIYKYSWEKTKQEQYDITYLFYSITNELKEKYENVKVVNFTEPNSQVTIDGRMVNLRDCELLIDPEDSTLKLLSFSDTESEVIIDLIRYRNNPNDTILWSSRDCFKPLTSEAKCNIIIPPYVKRFASLDLDMAYELKKDTTKKLDKFVFRGNHVGIPRNVIFSLMKEKYKNHFTGPDGVNTAENYLLDMITHKVGLSVAGAAELCYRDVEYMGVGTPMMRFEYISQTTPPLIPNYHYISIPRVDNDHREEYYCGKENKLNNFRDNMNELTDFYADIYYNKFLEIKDDEKFLDYVSANARTYYDQYLHPSTRSKHIISLLGV